MSDYLYKSIRRDLGRAISAHKMIHERDRILVGVSGGKDSLVLLWHLKERLAYVPINYDIVPVHIDVGYSGTHIKKVKEFCSRLGLFLHVERTDYGLLAHSKMNRENPCFLCARLRRKRIFELADEFECNKIAFGHNKDDIIETLFVNIFFSGRIQTMKPVESFFNGKFSLIRPMVFVDAERNARFAAQMNIPVFKNTCPSAYSSARNTVREILNELYRTNRKIKHNIFSAMSNVNLEYMPEQK